MFTFVFMLFLFASLQEAWSIKCWECHSNVDPNCGDPFDNSTFTMSNCNYMSLETMRDVKDVGCRRILKRINGVSRIIRSCVFLGEETAKIDKKICVNVTGRQDIFVEYCTCIDEDGCNSE